MTELKLQLTAVEVQVDSPALHKVPCSSQGCGEPAVAACDCCAKAYCEYHAKMFMRRIE